MSTSLLLRRCTTGLEIAFYCIILYFVNCLGPRSGMPLINEYWLIDLGIVWVGRWRDGRRDEEEGKGENKRRQEIVQLNWYIIYGWAPFVTAPLHLHPVSLDNHILNLPMTHYLVIPAGNTGSIVDQITNTERWATDNNLRPQNS